VTYENLVSGPGLQNLHDAVCLIAGRKKKAQRAGEILGHPDNPENAQALRLFHEFMGLAANTAVVAGHGYGGLYLTGGMVDRLNAGNLFDFDSFSACFSLPSVSSVERDLAATQIALVKEPHLAMRGLLQAGQST